MQVTGKVKRVEEIKTVGANDFKTREIVVVTEEQYEQTIAIQFKQGNVTILDNYKEGDKVKIDINIKGRDWTNAEGKTTCFNTIEGWKIEKVA
jgi:translation initiation factor IF-3